MRHLKAGIALLRSLRMRLVALAIVFTVATTGLLEAYTLQQFEAATTLEMQHVGILLSNALEASIAPAIEAVDIPSMQAQIDRIVAAREQDDIEINIMLLEGERSAIVASNDPDNIEETSPEEHTALLDALNSQRPVVFVEQDDESDDDPDETPLSEGRYLSITTPLIANERKLGSINVKLSLFPLDKKLKAIRWTILGASAVAALLIMIGLGFLIDRALRPVDQIARAAQSISAHDLSQRLNLDLPDDEFGRLARTFDAMIARLDDAFRRQRHFTADASHELRTPLTIIKGVLSLALARPRDAGYYSQVLSEIDKEVDHMRRLVERLLTLARADAEGLTLHRQTVNLGVLLDDLVGHIRPSASAKGLTLTAQLAPDLTVSADPDAITQAVLNLLDNAIKYTSSGQVRLSACANSDMDQIRISISDSGPGISAEHLPYIFDRFYRVDRARSREMGGAGLGLPIARELVRAHGGDVTVHSTPGEGSTFTIHLPLA